MDEVKLLEVYITREDYNRLSSWRVEQHKKATAPGDKYPNYGAIGGSFTYKITYTSLGRVLKVENTITGDILDLSHYEDW